MTSFAWYSSQNYHKLMTQQNGIVSTYDQAVESETEHRSTNKEHQLKVCCKKCTLTVHIILKNNTAVHSTNKREQQI